MGEQTGIAWTDHTFNPWIGCTAVSPACAHCYAEALAKRYGWNFAARRRTSENNWRNPRRWNLAAERDGVRRRVFCASLADVFDNQVPSEWRADLWEMIRACPALDWQLLTKRPQNIRKMLPADWGDGWPNVWLGTTAEDQREADRRILHLLDVPALRRFVSVEPLLGPLEIGPGLSMHRDQWCNWRQGGGIHWVIVGGESGPGARRMDPSWAMDLLLQCAAQDVPFFFKQVGSNHQGWPNTVTGKGDAPEQWPVEFRDQQFPQPAMECAA